MATGQFVYNLEDYAGMGGLVSTRLADKRIVLNNEMSASDKVNIFANVFASPNTDSNGGGINVSNVTKIGIQAPPGTKFYINAKPKNSTEEDENSVDTAIMVGRTGIYELEVPNMTISNLYFKRPEKYIIDNDLSQKAINTGRMLMEKAKNEFDQSYKNIYTLYDTAVDTESNKDFWEEYEKIHDTYVTQYEAARAEYVRGLSGIYTNSIAGSDLYNIIIDYKYDLVNEEGN